MNQLPTTPSPDYYVVVDLEATCSEGNQIQREKMETIEIGAVMLETKTLTAIDEFQSFVKPIRFPVLTEFCKQVTTIQQADIDRAEIFPTVASQLGTWLKSYPGALFSSWGDYDRYQIEGDCQFHGIETPFEDGHLNIKQLFASHRKLKRSVGMSAALEMEGLEATGTHHRGIDDARNITLLLKRVIEETRAS